MYELGGADDGLGVGCGGGTGMVLSGVVRALGLVRARVWKWECMGGRARVETLGLVCVRV